MKMNKKSQFKLVFEPEIIKRDRILNKNNKAFMNQKKTFEKQTKNSYNIIKKNNFENLWTSFLQKTSLDGFSEKLQRKIPQKKEENFSYENKNSRKKFIKPTNFMNTYERKIGPLNNVERNKNSETTDRPNKTGKKMLKFNDQYINHLDKDHFNEKYYKFHKSFSKVEILDCHRNKSFSDLTQYKAEYLKPKIEFYRNDYSPFSMRNILVQN